MWGSVQLKTGKTRDIKFLSNTANIWDATLRTGSEMSLFLELIFHTGDQYFPLCTRMISEPAAVRARVCLYVCVFVCLSVPRAVFIYLFIFAAVCCELVKVAGQITTSVSCN